MTTTTEMAPGDSVAAEPGAETENPTKGTINMSESTTTTSETVRRYIALDADVYDEETGLIAGFPDAEQARFGAEWLNGPDATPGDYHWGKTPKAGIDEGPYMGDLLRAAAILRLAPNELFAALAPLFRAKREQQKAVSK